MTMARRKLSLQGRIVAAGVSLGVAGALAGFMAAGDHTADASQPANASSSRSTDSFGSRSTDDGDSGYANPYDDGGDSSSSSSSGSPSDFPQFTPQPQTRTGGS